MSQWDFRHYAAEPEPANDYYPIPVPPPLQARRYWYLVAPLAVPAALGLLAAAGVLMAWEWLQPRAPRALPWLLAAAVGWLLLQGGEP